MITLKVNDLAPDFLLPDQHGKYHALSQYRGKWVLIYFYPWDNTPQCVKEARTIRDNFPDFQKLNIIVLGVSADSVKSHERFAQWNDLPFPLLADTQRTVVNNYGVWEQKSFLGIKYMGTLRTSFLINPEGKIARIYEKVKAGKHAQEVLNDMKSAQ